ncbi:MAG: hypothetical protein UU81_C0022G0014 [Microgenomates group bacterium GW2011_GWC1_41_8]|uniref:Uncharacterized protein n=3 Tax=Candidatus Roizmaniibacteriota TaxID=1752723 RepID=A0A0G0XBX0_9BACT|nr:MAG: hypothetical protein UT85_C0009G0013 [Candidatus Levybacteria bacterium GW2011_GWA2_40_16]KKR71991.1 MAG: hypothetical protein UU14_C0014G0013 [Candidatus Roizmanbacteria bacterium GW2011_GWB1_40_7]KKR93963.1 MAG: hypothetical protein UU41_C0016G0010 [Candidatus Roizmanbacteria bacterium GW2011_GWA1_41_13]KKS22464.1 MAG: hypothetical protein UU78_C0016G0009 [Candidatus Roizmanbacteria bacterium GW2011_GWC2_41_7]KKS23679.1 MAG: hypothetical protein UU81_C0022G0014 [Microgenomates group b
MPEAPDGNGYHGTNGHGHVETNGNGVYLNGVKPIGTGPVFEKRLGIEDIHVGNADYYLGKVDIPGGQPHWGDRGQETIVVRYFAPHLSTTIYVNDAIPNGKEHT